MGDGTPPGTGNECVHCGGPATHQHALTDEYLCCGHAAVDIDAEPLRDDHECEKFYTVKQFTRDLECDHRDNPNPPTGDLVPCHETAEWRITTSRFPGDTLDPDHPGAPTAARYCEEHFTERLRTIMDRAEGDQLEVRPRDWR